MTGSDSKHWKEGSCARELFITKPKKVSHESVQGGVEEVASKLIEVSLQDTNASDEEEIEELNKTVACGEKDNDVVRSEHHHIDKEVARREVDKHQGKKKGWRRVSKEGGNGEKGAHQMVGVRRKGREDEEESEEMTESENCG